MRLLPLIAIDEVLELVAPERLLHRVAQRVGRTAYTAAAAPSPWIAARRLIARAFAYM